MFSAHSNRGSLCHRITTIKESSCGSNLANTNGARQWGLEDSERRGVGGWGWEEGKIRARCRAKSEGKSYETSEKDERERVKGKRKRQMCKEWQRNMCCDMEDSRIATCKETISRWWDRPLKHSSGWEGLPLNLPYPQPNAALTNLVSIRNKGILALK